MDWFILSSPLSVQQIGDILGLGPRIVRQFASDQVDNLFGNRGGMIAHPLGVLGNEMQMHAGGDIAWIFHHVGQEFAKQRVVHLVDFTVAGANILCQIQMPPGIGVQRI